MGKPTKAARVNFRHAAPTLRARGSGAGVLSVRPHRARVLSASPRLPPLAAVCGRPRPSRIMKPSWWPPVRAQGCCRARRAPLHAARAADAPRCTQATTSSAASWCARARAAPRAAWRPSRAPLTNRFPRRRSCTSARPRSSTSTAARRWSSHRCSRCALVAAARRAWRPLIAADYVFAGARAHLVHAYRRAHRGRASRCVQHSRLAAATLTYAAHLPCADGSTTFVLSSWEGNTWLTVDDAGTLETRRWLDGGVLIMARPVPRDALVLRIS